MTHCCYCFPISIGIKTLGAACILNTVYWIAAFVYFLVLGPEELTIKSPNASTFEDITSDSISLWYVIQIALNVCAVYPFIRYFWNDSLNNRARLKYSIILECLSV